MSKKKYGVYLAGPFFNEVQVAKIRKLEKILESYPEFSVYSPSRDGKELNPAVDSPELRTEVFESNVDNLTSNDIIIAVIDDRDIGTIWEMGCRYGRWMDHYQGGPDLVPDDVYRSDCPIIITYTDNDYGLNLMLAESVLCHCKGEQSLRNYLDKILDSSNLIEVERDLSEARESEIE